jgi:hypothetical protein
MPPWCEGTPTAIRQEHRWEGQDVGVILRIAFAIRGVLDHKGKDPPLDVGCSICAPTTAAQAGRLLTKLTVEFLGDRLLDLPGVHPAGFHGEAYLGRQRADHFVHGTRQHSATKEKGPVPGRTEPHSQVPDRFLRQLPRQDIFLG